MEQKRVFDGGCLRKNASKEKELIKVYDNFYTV